MERQIHDREAYRKLIETLRKSRNGLTAADMVAKTALPLGTVRELLPAAADEYSARLEVTESGEIRYSFPRGFTSKYRGFRATLRKTGEALKKGLKTFGAWFFKVWIMVTLLGYFVFFMLIALAALVLSTAAGSSNSNSRSSNRNGGLGGLYLASNLFNMIIRIWFYSELLKPRDGPYSGGRGVQGKPKGRPLHKAIFSFVFGDGDPNADWLTREKQAVIAWIQANRGVISLPEFMALTGNTPAEAEERICGYCAEFGGLPEATGDGTVVYRFDELLLRAEPQKKSRTFPWLSAPLKRLKAFSSNAKKMNGWFALINGVNLIFGSYFFVNALNTGAIRTQAALEASSYLYGFTYLLLSQVAANPLPLITVVLGIIPLVFSALFWLIPGLRALGLKRENEAIKLENLRKDGYGRIWDNPLSVKTADLDPQAPECRPGNLEAARDRVIKEIGAYAIPEVRLDDRGAAVYTFPDLAREKEALEKYRASVDPRASELGNIVFDSHQGLPGEP